MDKVKEKLVGLSLTFCDLDEETARNVTFAVKKAIRNTGVELSEGGLFDGPSRVNITYRFDTEKK